MTILLVKAFSEYISLSVHLIRSEAYSNFDTMPSKEIFHLAKKHCLFLTWKRRSCWFLTILEVCSIMQSKQCCKKWILSIDCFNISKISSISSRSSLYSNIPHEFHHAHMMRDCYDSFSFELLLGNFSHQKAKAFSQKPAFCSVCVDCN